MTLDRRIVEEDARLEQSTEMAATDLARHRWHWTLDESNPDRVTITEYARQVARAQRTIYRHAHGYAIYTPGCINITEAMERATLSADRQTAVTAVATARGQSFKQVNRFRKEEVNRVLSVGRQLAEENETTLEHEADRVAEGAVRREKASKRTKAAVTGSGFAFIELEGTLAKAQRHLLEAMDVIGDNSLEEFQVDLVQESIEGVRQALRLVEMRISGQSGVDWDAEMKELARSEEGTI